MADKTLRLVFSGISTLYPPPSANGDPPPDRAYVLMAANYLERRNASGGIVPPHFPFIYVSRSLLADPIPAPADVVDDDKLGPCHVYFLDNARVTLDPAPPLGVSYYRKPELPLSDRPGSEDVAPEDDIRWLADLRDIVRGHSALKPTASPTAAAIGPEVAAIVEVSGGMLKAKFPCKSVQPKTFADEKGNPVPGDPHVLANEFFIDIPYHNDGQVTLRVTPLRNDMPPTGLQGNALVLKWPENGELVIRMGNDTKEEAKLANSFERCNARLQPNGEPVVIVQDDDFDLHYPLIDLPDGAARPLPQNDPHQTQFDGCKPATTG
jgi:hypothetical protein